LVDSKNGSSTSSASGLPPKGILIIDCAPISHIDSVGVDALVEMFKDARKLDVQIKFASFSG
jgi:anti-anti-sigma regulatory factor